jgi:hypothetical protein
MADTSSVIFPDCNMWFLVTELLVVRLVLLMLRPTAGALWLGALIVPLHAQPAPQPPSSAQIKDVQVPKISSPPRLEQFLGGASRGDLRRIDDFRQRQPGDGVPVSRKTSAWIGYDDRNFYAVFVCQSPAGQTRARLSKREDIMSDDLIGVFFDTYHSGQRGYEFFVNPLGVQAEAALAEGQGDDFSFDTLWYSEGRLTPEGYAAMLTIPFRSLRFPAHTVQTWGLGLFRSIPTNNENSFWPPAEAQSLLRSAEVSIVSHLDGELPATRPAGFRFRGLFSCAPRPLAFHGLLNGAHVCKVLRSARSKFGGDQIVLRNKERGKARLRVKHSFNPALPCGVKINARQVGENIEASRIAPKTKEAAAIGEFLRANAFERCAKRGKRRIGCLCVCRVCFYENVDVLRKARLRVKDDSVPADNQVSNAMGMEGGQKVFVVLVHRVLSPNL